MRVRFDLNGGFHAGELHRRCDGFRQLGRWVKPMYWLRDEVEIKLKR